MNFTALISILYDRHYINNSRVIDGFWRADNLARKEALLFPTFSKR